MHKEYETDACPDCASKDFSAIAEGVCKCDSCGAIFPLFEDYINEEEFDRSNREEDDEEYGQ